MKIYYLIIAIFLAFSTLYAGKVKSSKSYLKKFEITIEPIGKDLDSLKDMLGGIEAKSSFVSTDFWGLKKTWYVKGSGADIIEKISQMLAAVGVKFKEPYNDENLFKEYVICLKL